MGRSGSPHWDKSEASVLMELLLAEMGKTRQLSGEGSRTGGRVSWCPQPLFPCPLWPTAWGCPAGAGATPLCPVSWQGVGARAGGPVVTFGGAAWRKGGHPGRGAY